MLNDYPNYEIERFYDFKDLYNRFKNFGDSIAFENNGVEKVVLGHIHGAVYFPLKSEKNGIGYYMTSCDKTAFSLVKKLL